MAETLAAVAHYIHAYPYWVFRHLETGVNAMEQSTSPLLNQWKVLG